MARDYHVHRRSRLPLIMELYRLGFAYKKIADAVGVSEATIQNDLSDKRNKIDPARRPNERVAFPIVLKRWIEINKSTDTDLQKLSAILAAWLRIDELNEFVMGVEMTMETLCHSQVTPEQSGYLRLINAIFRLNRTATAVEVDRCRSHQYREYLNELREETRPLPDSHEAIRMELLDVHVRALRESIAPIWPNDGSVEAHVGRSLKTLTPREETILRMRFGIGGSEHTLAEIGAAFEVTPGRARQIHDKGLRKLRHPSRSKRLVCMWQTVGDAMERALRKGEAEERESALRTQQEQTKDGLIEYLKKTSPLSLSRLLEYVDVLHLSPRSLGCLRNWGIEYVGQLIQLKDADLLERKNLGRKSLAQIKDRLLCDHISLDMRIDPDLKQAFDAEIERRAIARRTRHH